MPFDASILPPNLAVIYRKVCRLLSLRSANDMVEKLSQILDPQSRKQKYSLRTIEFFLTEYTSRHAEDDVTLQMIHESYQRLVNSYSKKHFDCFARDVRVPVSVAGKTIQTTPAQLHFLQWFFDQAIDVEIERRVDEIRQEMKQKAGAATTVVPGADPEDAKRPLTRRRRESKKEEKRRKEAEEAEEAAAKKKKEEEAAATTNGAGVVTTVAADLSAGELRLYAKQVERLKANLRARRNGLSGTSSRSLGE